MASTGMEAFQRTLVFPFGSLLLVRLVTLLQVAFHEKHAGVLDMQHVLHLTDFL